MPLVETKKFISSAVPMRYEDASFDGFTPSNDSQRQALEAVRRIANWVTDDSAEAPEALSAVLIGPPGVGKTHLAAACCHVVANHILQEYEIDRAADRAALDAWDGRSWNDKPRPKARLTSPLPQWVNVPSMVVDLRAEMNLPPDDQETTTKARDLRTYSGLLVMDDLGREKISDWTGELIYTIVNDRYERRNATIVTSNLSTEELAAAGYWPAISRLAEDGRIVTITAPDHRLRR